MELCSCGYNPWRRTFMLAWGKPISEIWVVCCIYEKEILEFKKNANGEDNYERRSRFDRRRGQRRRHMREKGRVDSRPRGDVSAAFSTSMSMSVVAVSSFRPPLVQNCVHVKSELSDMLHHMQNHCLQHTPPGAKNSSDGTSRIREGA
jgi:hypothetical protein